MTTSKMMWLTMMMSWRHSDDVADDEEHDCMKASCFECNLKTVLESALYGFLSEQTRTWIPRACRHVAPAYPPMEPKPDSSPTMTTNMTRTIMMMVSDDMVRSIDRETEELT